MPKILNLRIAKGDTRAIIPCYASEGAAGFDLVAIQDGEIPPKETRLVSTGLIFEIPEGHVGIIKDRSSLFTKQGIETGAGVIDADYRGIVQAALLNNTDKIFHYKKGDRVCQMLILKLPKINFIETNKDELSKTDRGEGAFGSTGKNLEDIDKSSHLERQKRKDESHTSEKNKKNKN
jgi:dUTP pyrophosphatase